MSEMTATRAAGEAERLSALSGETTPRRSNRLMVIEAADGKFSIVALLDSGYASRDDAERVADAVGAGVTP